MAYIHIGFLVAVDSVSEEVGSLAYKKYHFNNIVTVAIMLYVLTLPLHFLLHKDFVVLLVML